MVDTWNYPILGNSMYRVAKKLKMLQKPLKALNKDHFGDVTVQFVAAKEKLNSIQFETRTKPYDVQLYTDEDKAWDDYHTWHNRLESFYVQKTKENWLNLGDSNDKISSYQKEDGQWTWDYEEVKQHFIQHYSDFLGVPTVTTEVIKDDIIKIGPGLDITQQLHLIRPFTKQDVKITLFSIPNHKSSGPYGYSSGFFKKSWTVIGDEVSQAMLDFFPTREIACSMEQH
ncbi:hypothetical protein Cgig2_019682 [Carnegiea gigantea]|uniref:Uncharacterized protein n=1 Tax=Carnegiea gigantea TaxID=171969 RepID=A0A9Q1QAA8_9CARY|nr:hypothetical protein Cgig2_019682 [Carnegiea gigantea]